MNGTLLPQEIREFRELKYIILQHWDQDQWLITPMDNGKYYYYLTMTLPAAILRHSKIIGTIEDGLYKEIRQQGLKFIFGKIHSANNTDIKTYNNWASVIKLAFEIEDMIEAIYQERSLEYISTMVDIDLTGYKASGVLYGCDDKDDVLAIGTYVDKDNDGNNIYWEYVVEDKNPKNITKRYLKVINF